MPRPKTYGKKSRPLGESHVVDFSSPEQRSRKCSTTIDLDLIEKCTKLRLKSDDARPEPGLKDQRRILGERNANCSTVKKGTEVGVSCQPEVNLNVESRSARKHVSRPVKEDIKKSEVAKISTKHETVVSSPRISSNSDRPRKTNTHIFFDDENTDAIEHHGEGIEHITRLASTSTDEKPLRHSEAGEVYDEHCSSLLSLSSRPSSAFSTFETWSAEVESHFAVSKLAEASFGEVYRLSLLDDIPEFSKADESVFKIIALKSPSATHPTDKRKKTALLKREELMSTPSDVANEVRLLQRMTHIPGFTNFRDIRILQGRPSGPFVAAFHEFDKSQKAKGKDGSHFPDPAKKASYAETQLWAIIEMQDAGTDLERLVEAGRCTSVWRTWDIFWHTTLALAKGEQGARFEHRDLHLGNICIRNMPGSSSLSSSTAREAAEEWLTEDIDVQRKLAFTPLDTTIIDYTLSRATMTSVEDDEDGDELEADTDIAYMDLSRDPAIFQGDSTEEYQYDIYRYMRGVLFCDDAYHDFDSNGNSSPEDHEIGQNDADGSVRTWSEYHPQTNLVWLHFVLYMLLEQIVWPSETRAPSKRPGKGSHAYKDEQAKHKLRVARHKRGKHLEAILLELQTILDPAQICANGVRSAGDLVALAMGEGWLDLQDVIGRMDSANDDADELEMEFEALNLEG
ncbi:uncharacterized protein K489DRAFT_380794 [Dissoconium aciculare CBS 342.82]|uniref:non-specific serine/threonine protein kinase n=1 Tax=Dissoconium aciculare CBS 342.82 TaxID=1314786 RepID=A0A6J3M5E9_9PEZI|nr:uncharacterized protein K489DRAFT_380794 [Dissoconium aciculare CBS 342.82]KAF1822062.1 hypothetical protein K489DRAFT_380794 [Dissoconium aciculare CBS 342.82]